MSDFYQHEIESDDRFASGEWSGYFQQPNTGNQRHWMSFRLEFRGGLMRGEGTDFVGPFSLWGKYETASGRCYWTKEYLGRHQVLYQGHMQPHGIVGQWTISESFTGPFHIWPKGLGGFDEYYLQEEAAVPY